MLKLPNCLKDTSKIALEFMKRIKKENKPQQELSPKPIMKPVPPKAPKRK